MAGDPRPRPRFAAAGGFTPQAKNLPRLRRSNQGVTPEGLHGGSTSGANLFQDETFGSVEHPASQPHTIVAVKCCDFARCPGGRIKISIRRLVKWALWGMAAVVVLVGCYLSIFFFPYPLFPHHAEHAGFSVNSDREIAEDFELVLDEARSRVEAMELYRGAKDLRIFVCRSQRLFVFLNRLAGKGHGGQALVISVAGNAFFSEQVIESVGRRNGRCPVHSRLEGSWSAAIAHEVAHDLVFSEVGCRETRQIPVWISEGFADYSANLVPARADPDYDFRERIGLLLDDDSWRSTMGYVDRRHFRWHVLVEYLCSVKGLTFTDLMDAGVTEESAESQMMSWYSACQFDEDRNPTVGSRTPGP